MERYRPCLTYSCRLSCQVGCSVRSPCWVLASFSPTDRIQYGSLVPHSCTKSACLSSHCA